MNNSLPPEAHPPFGGNGLSGNGSRQSGNRSRQSGNRVLDQFTRWRSVNWDYSGRLQKAQMDTTELTPDPYYRLEMAEPGSR